MDNEQIPAMHPGDEVFDSTKMGEVSCNELSKITTCDLEQTLNESW